MKELELSWANKFLQSSFTPKHNTHKQCMLILYFKNYVLIALVIGFKKSAFTIYPNTRTETHNKMYISTDNSTLGWY